MVHTVTRANPKNMTHDRVIGIPHDATDSMAAFAIAGMLRGFLLRMADRGNMTEAGAIARFAQISGYECRQIRRWRREGILDGKERSRLLGWMGKVEP